MAMNLYDKPIGKVREASKDDAIRYSLSMV